MERRSQMCQDLPHAYNKQQVGEAGKESRESRAKAAAVWFCAYARKSESFRAALVPCLSGAYRELGKFEDALHECQAILNFPCLMKLRLKVLEQIRHVFHIQNGRRDFRNVRKVL